MASFYHWLSPHRLHREYSYPSWFKGGTLINEFWSLIPYLTNTIALSRSSASKTCIVFVKRIDGKCYSKKIMQLSLNLKIRVKKGRYITLLFRRILYVLPKVYHSCGKILVNIWELYDHGNRKICKSELLTQFYSRSGGRYMYTSKIATL